MVGDPQHPHKDRILKALFSTSKVNDVVMKYLVVAEPCLCVFV